MYVSANSPHRGIVETNFAIRMFQPRNISEIWKSSLLQVAFSATLCKANKGSNLRGHTTMWQQNCACVFEFWETLGAAAYIEQLQQDFLSSFRTAHEKVPLTASDKMMLARWWTGGENLAGPDMAGLGLFCTGMEQCSFQLLGLGPRWDGKKNYVHNHLTIPAHLWTWISRITDWSAGQIQ